MSHVGLWLLALVGALLVTTGLPAWVALIAAAITGAAIGVGTGQFPASLLSALPGRLLNLLENDLLQALPLFILMGSLLNRMHVVPALYKSLVWLLPRRPGAKTSAGLALGALLGPMSGSVGASVLALSRAVAPRLADSGVPPARRQAIVALGSTLGVVVPPSLVLILLGDAMLTAHTIAVNATGRSTRIINTQDVMHAALLPAALIVASCLLLAWFLGDGTPNPAGKSDAAEPAPIDTPTGGELAIAATALALLFVLLGGVAAGYFYAVEAAACGAVILFALGLISGRLRQPALSDLLSEVLVTTGALFAPLLAATTFTLVLRLLGTDKLIESFIGGLPGGETLAILTVLALMAATSLVLDAFEIIFVVVPILVPPLLMRVADASWVSTMILLTLQVSFLVPPAGYAVMMTQGVLGREASVGSVARVLAPFLAAEVAVLALVLWLPALTHAFDPSDASARTQTEKPLGKEELDKRFREMLPPPSIGGLPPLGAPPFASPAK